MGADVEGWSDVSRFGWLGEWTEAVERGTKSTIRAGQIDQIARGDIVEQDLGNGPSRYNGFDSGI